MSFQHLNTGDMLKIHDVVYRLQQRGKGDSLTFTNSQTDAVVEFKKGQLLNLFVRRELSIIKKDGPLTRQFDDRAFESFSPAIQDVMLKRLVYVTACDRLFGRLATNAFVPAGQDPNDPSRMKRVPPEHLRAARRSQMARRPGNDTVYDLVAKLVSYGRRRIAVAEALHRRASRYDALSLARRDLTRPDCVNGREHIVTRQEDDSRPPKDLRPVKRLQEIPREAVSSYALRNWHARWVYSGRKIQALAPQHARKGRKGQALLDPRVTDLMDHVLKTYYLQRERPPLTLVYDAFRSILRDKSFKDASGKPLAAPSYMALSRRLKATTSRRDVIEARQGEFAAYAKEGPSGKMARTSIPMGLIEIDHTQLDAFVLGEDGSQPRRPWLTAAIDVATRMVAGVHLTFEKPSWRSVMYAMRHAMQPKDTTDCESTWPISGIPFAIRMDNGKEFKSASMVEMGLQLRIDLQWCPPRKPNCKPHIERFFGNVARDFCAREGRSFANTREKGDYCPTTKELVDLSTLTAELTRWIVERYHNHPHSGLMFESPLACFNRLDQITIRRPASDLDLRVLMSMVLKGTVSKSGIRYLGLTYRNEKLDKLFEAMRSEPGYGGFDKQLGRAGKGLNWQLRLDPDDISHLFVLDPQTGAWEKIPCIYDIAQGHSLTSWRAICAQAKAETSAGDTLSVETLERVAEQMLKRKVALPRASITVDDPVDQPTLNGEIPVKSGPMTSRGGEQLITFSSDRDFE